MKQLLRIILQGSRWVSRSKIPLLMIAITLYGMLLRFNGYYANSQAFWGAFGVTSDEMTIMDASARFVETGRLSLVNGTFALVTGLFAFAFAIPIFSVFGVYPGYKFLIMGLTLLGGLLPVVGYLATRAAFQSRAAGLSVAAFLAMEPLLVSESRTLNHDMASAICVGLSLWALYPVLRQQQFSPRQALKLGVILGFSILVKFSLMCLLGVVLGSAALHRKTRALWKNVGLALVIALLPVTVWVWRNTVVVGAPMVASGTGVLIALGTGRNLQPPPGAGGEIAKPGQEKEFTGAYLRQVWPWIKQHPREYAFRIVQKIGSVWTTVPSPWWRWLLWGVGASVVVMLAWERWLLPSFAPVALYLIFFSIAYGLIHSPVPRYFPSFVSVMIIALGPGCACVLGRSWRWSQKLLSSRPHSKILLDNTLALSCLGFGLLLARTDIQALFQYRQRAATERKFLQWVGTALPPEAVIVKTNVGDPWEAQRYSQRPVVFNPLYDAPWIIYKTPYTTHDYQRDYQHRPDHFYQFRFDIAREDAQIDRLTHLTPPEIDAIRSKGLQALLAFWRHRGRPLFVLDTDARGLVETYLPLNAYALRGDELTLKFYGAFPQNPQRAIYRLVEFGDPRLAQFGPGAEQVVQWMTPPCADRSSTTFWFTGSFGPKPGFAKILVNGRYAMRFGLGQDGDCVWDENGYRLTYRQWRPRWITSVGPSYSVGVYALTVPAPIVTPGHALTISVSPLLVTENPDCWFGLVDRRENVPVSADRSPQSWMEGFQTLTAASEVLRQMDDGLGHRRDIWLARSQRQPC